jgi:hypothetical protein
MGRTAYIPLARRNCKRGQRPNLDASRQLRQIGAIWIGLAPIGWLMAAISSVKEHDVGFSSLRSALRRSPLWSSRCCNVSITRIFLYNVKTDPGERQDWFARRQDIAQRLQQLLAEWERDVDAEAKTFAATRK